MKEILHKITAYFMALVVLFSTMSFSVDMHFCGDSLVDVSVFSQAKSCGMDAIIDKDCPETSLKKDCCDEELVTFQGEKELQLTSIQDLSVDQQLFIVSYVYTYVNLFEGLQEREVPYKNYTPPLIVKDIQLLDDVFLI